MNLFFIFILGIAVGAGAVWFFTRSKIKTSEVADLFEVSRAAAFRYLEELEQEGKIEQIGAFGRNVEYRIKGR